MAKKFFLLFTVILSQQVLCAQSTDEQFIFPAEFDKTDAIWMTWSIDPARADDNKRIMIEMIAAIIPSAKVNLFITHDDSLKHAAIASMLKAGIDTLKINFYYTDIANRFQRDFGPLFLRGNHGHLKGINYGFNCWGNCDPQSERAQFQGSLDSITVANMNLPIVKAKLYGEGGNRDFNGKGTMMVTEDVELDRNPGWTKAQMEVEYKRVFGVRKIIWLKKGVVSDESARSGLLPCGMRAAGTGGHIDDFCRFANDHTILLADPNSTNICDSIRNIDKERMEENYQILKAATDQDGKPFTIIRIPMADYSFTKGVIRDRDVSYFKGSHLGDSTKIFEVWTYANFVIANDVILLPKYYKSGRPNTIQDTDARVLEIFKQVFPDKKIVQIETSGLSRSGGMHCATQNQPGN